MMKWKLGKQPWSVSETDNCEDLLSTPVLNSPVILTTSTNTEGPTFCAIDLVKQSIQLQLPKNVKNQLQFQLSPETVQKDMFKIKYLLEWGGRFIEVPIFLKTRSLRWGIMKNLMFTSFLHHSVLGTVFVTVNSSELISISSNFHILGLICNMRSNTWNWCQIHF